MWVAVRCFCALCSDHLLCRHDLHAEDKENREKLSRDMQAALRSGASQRVQQAKEAMEAYTPEVPDALRDYIAIVFTSAITSTLVEALFSCVPSLDVACVIVQAVRGWCCCCRHMAYLKSQHRARMTDETMVSNIGAKDFPDPTDNPERPLEKLEIDPEVALGHELSYGY